MRTLRKFVTRKHPSFDDFVGGREQFKRHGEAERLRCLEIDGQNEFGWLEDRNVGRFGPFQNLAPAGGAAACP
jgi:hypothetical protein